MKSRTPWWLAGAAGLFLAGCSGGGNDPAPGARDGTGQPPPTQNPNELPLLDLSSMRSPMMKACHGKPDDTPLPVDPRSLVVEGIDTQGAAVQFNAYWVDLRNPGPPYKPNPLQRPKTCGEWRTQDQAGAKYMRELTLTGGAISAAAYNQLWRAWDATARPANFDEEVILRYGLAPAPFPNPYPKEGEDPKTTNGGTGQLPLGLVQIKDEQGQYTGKLSFNCSICHDSEFGTPADGPGFGTVFGRGNDNFDMATMNADFAKLALLSPGPETLGGLAQGVIPIPLSGTTRGVTDPDTGFEVLLLTRDLDTMDSAQNGKAYPIHTSSGSIDGITWPNLAYRPRKFQGGDLSSDETRSMQALLLADTGRFGDGDTFKAQQVHFEGVKTWIESLEMPDYPRPINIPKAEAGAVLFHKLDLWSRPGSPSSERPGNGSCAACHGAYSPRFAADPTILHDPRLRGVAGYLVKTEVVGTDRNRANQVGGPTADQLNEAWNTSWLSYVELHEDYEASNQSGSATTLEEFLNDYETYVPGTRLKGPNQWQTTRDVYVAPPLWGVWATAPYFHNGSVPDIWGVLSPASERPKVWRRQLKQLPGGVNKGFDRSLNAYDMEKLGWKHEVIPCDAPGIVASATCSPGQDPVNMFLAAVANVTGPISWMTYLYLPPYTQDSVEARLVYNTHLFTQGNGGHEFSNVLTNDERWAIIEYLKTL